MEGEYLNLYSWVSFPGHTPFHCRLPACLPSLSINAQNPP
jgi:hypothetical protein